LRRAYDVAVDHIFPLKQQDFRFATWQLYTGEFKKTRIPAHYLQFYSKDAIGNVEPMTTPVCLPWKTSRQLGTKSGLVSQASLKMKIVISGS